MTESPAELLPILAEQEKRLVFSRFDHASALALGMQIVDRAWRAELPIVVSIRRNGQRLFHIALPGSSADNDSWVDRKAAVVDRYGHSSYFVGTQFRARGRDFDADSRLDTNLFAAHGGSFPITIRAVGCVGSITVSGLAQADDHALVVAELEEFLRQDDRQLG